MPHHPPLPRPRDPLRAGTPFRIFDPRSSRRGLGRLTAALDVALWPCLTTAASLLAVVDGGRLLSWLRNDDPGYEPDLIA